MADPADTPSPRAKEEAVRRVNVRRNSHDHTVDDVTPSFPRLYELALSIDREGVVFTEAEKDQARFFIANYPNSDRTPLLRKIAGPDPVDPLLVEARRLCADADQLGLWGKQALAGKKDDDFVVQTVLSALRRGMELAQQSGEAK
jgi:hypothetical protein